MPAPARVAFPARCAVAVVCGEHLVSQVYPASVPIEVFIDDVVELLNTDLRRRGLDSLELDRGHELHKANGVRLDVTRTLDELGVEDGATLVLAPRGAGDSFEPQYESLSTGLARAGRRLFEPVGVETAARTALLVVAMVLATGLGLALRARMATDSLTPSAVAGTAGLLTAGAAAVVWRWWPQRHPVLLDGFAGLAVPLLAVSLAAGTPGVLGAPHLFIAVLAAALLICGVTAVTGRFVATAAAAVALCGLAGAVAAARMWQPLPAQWLGMGTLAGLLVLLTSAPTIALWSARIRPPHFGSITGRDLFRRDAELPADAVAPVGSADDGREIDRDTTERGDRVTVAAVRANSVLTGICAAVGLALPAAAWATLTPHGRHGVAAGVLVGLFVVIFVSRGRAFADKRQAVALVCGAAAAVCAGAVRYVLADPAGRGPALPLAALVLTGFGSAALLAGLWVPGTKFTPLVRVIAEWLELAAIVAALPLAAWIGGLFGWVRMR